MTKRPAGDGIWDTHVARIAAVFASTGAGIVHTLLTDDHWNDWKPSGLFFAVMSVTQFGWAMLAARRADRPLMIVGVAANAGLILLWAVSRMVGLPFGSHAGDPEQIAAADLLTVCLELVVCVAAGWSLRPPRARLRSLPQSGAAAVGIALLVTACTVPAITDAAAGHSHGTGHGHSGDGHSGDGHPGDPAGDHTGEHSGDHSGHPHDGTESGPGTGTSGGGGTGQRPRKPAGSPSPTATHDHSTHRH